MRYLIAVVIIFAGLVIWALTHRYQMVPKWPVRGSLTELQDDLKNNDSTWKVVVVTASWCPACRMTMPAYAHLDMGSYVDLYALSLDRSQDQFLQTARELGGNIKWVRARECDTDYCYSLLPMLKTIGIHYAGTLPYVSIFEPDGHVYKENIPIEYIECTIRHQCDVECSKDRCEIRPPK